MITIEFSYPKFRRVQIARDPGGQARRGLLVRRQAPDARVALAQELPPELPDLGRSGPELLELRRMKSNDRWRLFFFFFDTETDTITEQ